jgi:hypothetical protein
MPIGPSISVEHGVFEPGAVALMGEAFDAACADLPSSDQSDDVRELIALLIIAAALRGETDPLRLRKIALSELWSLEQGPSTKCLNSARTSADGPTLADFRVEASRQLSGVHRP